MLARNEKQYLIAGWTVSLCFFVSRFTLTPQITKHQTIEINLVLINQCKSDVSTDSGEHGERKMLHTGPFVYKSVDGGKTCEDHITESGAEREGEKNNKVLIVRFHVFIRKKHK
jgi:hypothetical protein